MKEVTNAINIACAFFPSTDKTIKFWKAVFVLQEMSKEVDLQLNSLCAKKWKINLYVSDLLDKEVNPVDSIGLGRKFIAFVT